MPKAPIMDLIDLLNFANQNYRKLMRQTERQKQNAKLWADAAKVTLSDPLRHNPKAGA